MGRGDGDLDGNHLSRGEAVDGGAGGVGVLEAAALPEVALGGAKVGLRLADLGHGLNVAVGVRGHLVVDLGAAGGLHGGAKGTGRGRGESAVGRDAGGEEGGGGDLLVHLEWLLGDNQERMVVDGFVFLFFWEINRKRLGPGEVIGLVWFERM